jgi:Flp pilus assembly protein protease CpaA
MQISSYPFLISAIAILVTLFYASYWDLRHRRFPHKYWYPLILFCAPVSALGYYELFLDGRYWFGGILGLTVIICVIAYAMGLLGLCGGADTWAIIFIAVFVPVFPLVPFFGIPVHSMFALSVLVISVILNLSIPVYLYMKNTFNHENISTFYKFLVHKVPIRKIASSHGYIVESGEGEIIDSIPEFLPISCVLRGGESGGMLDIRDIVDSAGNVYCEYQRYVAKGYVWVLYPSPFLVFITIGFFTSLFFGDVLRL